MNRSRFRRRRRRGLTPAKVILVYGLAFLLVVWHQSGPMAEWFESQALNREGRPAEAALAAAAFLKKRIEPYGPAQLNRWEDRLLARLSPSGEIGAFKPAGGHTPAEAASAETGPPNGVPSETVPSKTAPSETAPSETVTAVPPESGAGRLSPPVWPPPLPETAVMDPTNSAEETADTPGTENGAGGTAAEAEPEIFSPLKVLLLGDSMMLEGLGPQLQKELRRNFENLEVVRDGRYGTGLTRLDYFDWLDYFERMLAKHSPDLVILTIGANDPQDILSPDGPSGRRRVLLATDDWNALYAARVKKLLSLAEARRSQVFWIGLPIMGLQPYGRRTAAVNAVAAAACEAAPNCRFWDSWLSVADEQGRFTSFALDENGRRQRIRAKDSIHLTEDGGRIMARKFLAETRTWADYQARREPSETPENERPAAAPLRAPPLPPAPADALSATEPEEKWEFVEPYEPPADDSPPEISSRRPAPSAGDGDLADALEPASAFWVEDSFLSPALGRTAVLRLAVPRPRPDRPGPFPVILLLHGAWDGAEAWERELGRPALLELAGRLGLILALPDAGPLCWYLDGRETAAETFLLADFLPEALKNPAADPDRLALAGLSMGGHGALTLAFKRPDLFKAAAALSAVVDLAAHAESGRRLDAELGLERVLGPAGPGGRDWRPFSAAGLWAARPTAWGGRPLFLGVGRDDSLTLAENRAFHRQLTAQGLAHVYLEKPGGHDWAYWRGELPILAAFLAEALGASPVGRAGRP